jgi:chromosome segregation ATPase
MILERMNDMSARSAAILAQITANTDALKSVATAADALKEGQSTIAAEIAALKAQIAAGGAADADFAALETAVTDQSAVVEGLKTAIPAGTKFDPSANG